MLFRSDRKSTRLNSSHTLISYAVFCLKKKNTKRLQRSMSQDDHQRTRRHRGTETAARLLVRSPPTATPEREVFASRVPCFFCHASGSESGARSSLCPSMPPTF